MSDFKTPLAKVRGLGSAKSGTHHWWVQRLTAIANIPLTIFVLVSFAANAGESFEGWRQWMQQPVVAVLLMLFVANLFYHMKLGLQVFIEDYISAHGKKLLVLTAISFACIFMGSLSVFSILTIALGGF